MTCNVLVISSAVLASWAIPSKTQTDGLRSFVFIEVIGRDFYVVPVNIQFWLRPESLFAGPHILESMT
jgi:hypothetical protein